MKISIKLTCCNFILLNYFLISLFLHIPKDLSAKCYPSNKGRLWKKLVKEIKVSLKKKKKKSNNMVVNDTKIYQDIKNKSLSSIEKNVIKWKKTSYYGYTKLLLKNNDDGGWGIKECFERSILRLWVYIRKLIETKIYFKKLI